MEPGLLGMPQSLLLKRNDVAINFRATTVIANYGTLSIGDGAWDGVSTGHFVGSTSGTIYAGNAASGFAGNLLDLQLAGSKRFHVESNGFIPGPWQRFISGNGYNLRSDGTSVFTPAEAAPYAMPFYVPNACTLNQLVCNVTTGGSTGAVVRMGIYADNVTTGLPGALLVDGGAVSTTTTGIKAVSISLAVQPGLYWITACAQGAAATKAIYRACQGSNVGFIAVSSGTLTANLFNVAYQGLTATGALGGTWTGLISAAVNTGIWMGAIVA